MTLKVGDKVRILTGAYRNDVATVYAVYGMGHTAVGVCIGGVLGAICYHKHELEKLEDTMFKVGDLITKDDVDGTRKVLAVCGEAFLMSFANDYEVAYDWMTFARAEKLGYHLASDTVSITVEGRTKKISRQSAKELGLI